MLLLALSFGDMFFMSRKMGANSMAVSGLSSEKNLDWCWVGCFSLPMHKQPEKTTLLPDYCGEVFNQSGPAVDSQEL